MKNKLIILTSIVFLSFNRDLNFTNANSSSFSYVDSKQINTTSNNYFNDLYYFLQWQNESINAERAWDVFKPIKKVKVAVLDSGISETTTDVNYCLNTVQSKSFHPSYSSYYADENTSAYKLEHIVHGTAVGSLICAKQDNQIGIAGLNNYVDLISIRVFDNYGKFYDDLTYLADAINYCESIGVDIINLSGKFSNYNEKVYNAIENFNGLLVCSSGNEYQDIDDEYNSYPSNYKLDNILSVGAIDKNDELWKELDGEGTNYGVNNVDIFAPGFEVCTNGFENYGAISSGTSFATPLVAGAASMYLSMYGEISPIELKNKIVNSSTSINNLKTKCVSGGKLNIFDLLHTHNYSTYETYDTKKHKKVCSCGDSILGGHVVAGGSFEGGKRYANCLLCSGLAEIGLVIETNNESFNTPEFELINGLYYVKKSCYIDDIYNLSYEDYLNYEK